MATPPTPSAGDVLVVDDNRVNVGLLTGILQKRHYAVRNATEGQQALDLMRAAPAEIVLLDIRLPGMDGYEICRQLKADPKTRDIPVIFVSALDDGLDKARAFEVGGVDYVAKPFSAAEVVARVENQLKLSRLQRQMTQKNTELERANRMLQSLSYLDALTGIPNRRHFDELLDQEWRRALRDESSMCVILIDVDLFKAFNDTYGHQSGDDCLKHVAVEVSGVLRRGGDLAARYGGEEFGVVLPGTEAPGGVLVAEDIRRRVEGLKIAHKGSPHQVVTISLGMKAVRPGPQDTPETLLAAADRALYRAKELGRNRLVTEGT
jgi:diguanylate cyclase (GGDEF)-like protein